MADIPPETITADTPPEAITFVIFTEDGWTTEHSVECRLSGQMHRCAWHEAVGRRFGTEFDPELEGRWLIREINGDGVPVLERAEADDG